MEQVSLFGSDDLKAYEKLRLEAIKSKRIRFKNPTYTKFYKEDKHTDGTVTDSIDKWGKMNRLYIELANMFPFPTRFDNDYHLAIDCGDDTYYIDTGIIRTYKIGYQKEKYTHKGDDGVVKTYQGEEFYCNFAEVIGTEDLGINERLFIHSELMYYLDEGYRLKDLTMWLDELVNWFDNGWNAELLLIMFITRGFKNEYE